MTDMGSVAGWREFSRDEAKPLFAAELEQWRLPTNIRHFDAVLETSASSGSRHSQFEIAHREAWRFTSAILSDSLQQMGSSNCLALPTDEITHPVHEHRVVFAGLIALFVALASALLPGSMPSSQIVGSAFNPATTQVALARNDAEETANLAAADTRSDTFNSGDTIDSADPGLPSLFWRNAPAFASMLPPPIHSAKDEVASERRLPGAGPRAPPGVA